MATLKTNLRNCGRVALGSVAVLSMAACQTMTTERSSVFSQLPDLEPSDPISDVGPQSPQALQNNTPTPSTSANPQRNLVAPERYVGSGQLFAPPTNPAGRAAGGGGDVVLNFVDSDIREVARAVFEDMLSLNYVIDPQVTGKVSLATSKPIRTNQILPLALHPA